MVIYSLFLSWSGLRENSEYMYTAIESTFKRVDAQDCYTAEAQTPRSCFLALTVPLPAAALHYAALAKLNTPARPADLLPPLPSVTQPAGLPRPPSRPLR